MSTLTPVQLAQIVAELQQRGVVGRRPSGAGYFTGVRPGTYPVPRNLIVDSKGRVVSVQSGQDSTDIEIQDEGTLVALRSILNFTGAGVVASDDPANSRVDVLIPGAALTSQVLCFGNNSVGATTTTRYMEPWYSDTLAETDGVQNARITFPRAGTLRNMYIRHGNPNGNGNAIVYTFRLSGVATALTASLASTGGTANDLVNSVAVAVGDTGDVQVTKAAAVGSSPNNITVCMEFAD